MPTDRFIKKHGILYHVPPALAAQAAPEDAGPNREVVQRASRVLADLKNAYPAPHCELVFSSPFELLIAAMLSAKVSDAHVNAVTPELFGKYPTPADFANASHHELDADITRIGLHASKARNIRRAARMIVEEYGGAVPDTMEGLRRLPGVGRKTANLVLGVGFGKNEGVIVDVHVARVARRLGLTEYGDSRRADIERDLMTLIPRSDWIFFGLAIIAHGRAVCTARTPACNRCPLAGRCTGQTRTEALP